MFQPKKSVTFERTVTVHWPDGSQGTIKPTFRTVEADEWDKIMDMTPRDAVDAVMVDPGPVGDTAGNPMPEAEARAAVLSDTTAVDHLFADYMEVKGQAFRRGKPGRRR